MKMKKAKKNNNKEYFSLSLHKILNKKEPVSFFFSRHLFTPNNPRDVLEKVGERIPCVKDERRHHIIVRRKRSIRVGMKALLSSTNRTQQETKKDQGGEQEKKGWKKSPRDMKRC